MKLIKNIFKIKNTLIALSILGVFAGSLSANVNAAEFLSGDNISTDKVYSNLYIAGDIIKINERTEKDLIVAGNDIEINKEVERNLIVAGNQIYINSNIGATVRAAGRNITVNGNVEEDLVLAGQKIIIENAVIKGDIVIGTSDLEIKNSIIEGNAYLSTKESKSEWDDQILGEINLNTHKMDEYEKNDNSFSWFGVVFGAIITLASLIAVTIFLNNRNRLIMRELKNGKTLIKDFLWGLGSIILGVFITILSIIFFNITVPFVMIIISIGIFSSVFAPIYLANIFLNSTNKNTVYLYIALSWFGLMVFGVLSEINIVFISGLIGFILGLFSLSVYGYLLRNLYNSMNKVLAKKETESIEVKSEEK